MFDGMFFVKLVDGHATLELVRHPNALALLTLIALRAFKGRGVNLYGLAAGEALIGDHVACGLSRRQYRTAQAWLAARRLAAFKPTTKGTIARLCGADVYDIGRDARGQQTVGARPTEGRQAATKSDRRLKSSEGERVPTASIPSSSLPASAPSSEDSGVSPALAERWAPALAALRATGKLPALRIEHLIFAARAYPNAGLGDPETVAEIVSDALGLVGAVGDTGAWVRRRCAALEARRLGIGRPVGDRGGGDRAARADAACAGVPGRWGSWRG